MAHNTNGDFPCKLTRVSTWFGGSRQSLKGLQAAAARVSHVHKPYLCVRHHHCPPGPALASSATGGASNSRSQSEHTHIITNPTCAEGLCVWHHHGTPGPALLGRPSSRALNEQWQADDKHTKKTPTPQHSLLPKACVCGITTASPEQPLPVRNMNVSVSVCKSQTASQHTLNKDRPTCAKGVCVCVASSLPALTSRCQTSYRCRAFRNSGNQSPHSYGFT